MEAAVATRAFIGSGTAINGVVIRGFIVEKFANDPGLGVIDGRDAWTTENMEIRLNHGAAVNGGIVRNNNIHHNGQMGIASGWDGMLVEGNEIAFNNAGTYAGSDGNCEAGGSKFTRLNGLTVRNKLCP